MKSERPYVSIGLPVFNGENYLEYAIQSILAQTYSDFELIISDNASTDRTQEICETYASQDHRVHYSRNPINLGCSPNFNRTFTLSKGTYFKWAAHDDIHAPTYLEKCVAVLDDDPSIHLCHARVKLINEAGEFVENFNIELRNVGSYKPEVRFADLIHTQHSCYNIFGLMRAETLRKIPLLASRTECDRILLVEIGLHGRFYEMPEFLFISRTHPEQSTKDIPLRYRQQWYDMKFKDGWTLPFWRCWYEHYACLKRVPLSKAEKQACYVQLLRYPTRTGGVRLWTDLINLVHPTYLGQLEQRSPRWYRGLQKTRRTVAHIRNEGLRKNSDMSAIV